MFGDQDNSQYIPYQPGAIIPIKTAKKLLASEEHQMVLHYIREYTSGLEPVYYDVLYKKLINDYAEFVQLIPIQPKSYLGSLLNVGLTRALNALYRYKSEKKNRVIVEAKDHLLIYAIFTAALLSSVSQAVTNQLVVLTDGKGFWVKDWVPYEGSMVGKGKFYKLRMLAKVYQAIDHWITPLLARQLMDEEGFLWIASDRAIFADWLAALQGEVFVGGQLSDLVDYVRRMDDVLIGIDIERLPPARSEMDIPLETEMAEKFLEWLKQSLEEKKLALNSPEAMVHVLQEGVFFQDGDLYREFLRTANYSNEALANKDALTAQLGYALGELQRISCFAQFDQQNKRFGTSFMAQQASMKHGVLIADPALLFSKGGIPPISPYLQAQRDALQTSLPNVQRMNPVAGQQGPTRKLF